MYCTSCGKQIADDAAFCPHCGMPVSSSDELAELVAAARIGDQDAIGALYEKTYSKVYYTVKSIIKDEDTVFDIVQDTYIKAFAHLNSFQGDTKFLPWIRRIAANTARDWLKKKRPMLFTELSSGDEKDTPAEELFPDERSENLPDQVIDQEETKRLIREIIEELPEDQRAAIGMFYYEEMSVKEIAAAMGVSESAVKSRLMYGRNKIETKVRELEKQGTKLYSLSPLPFLLLLFRNQKAYAAEAPDSRILHAILASQPMDGAAAAGAAQGVGTAGAGTGAGASTGAAAGSLGALKIGLVTLVAAAVVGLGIYGGMRIAFRSGESQNSQTIEGVIDQKESEASVEPSAVESQPTEEDTKDSTMEASQSTEEESSEGEEESLEAEDEAVCSYIFSDMPIAAFEITGLGIGPDVAVLEEPIVFEDGYSELIPLVPMTPGENTFVLYCFSGGNETDQEYYGISRAKIHSPSGSSPWEANSYTVNEIPAENVPEGWAGISKHHGEFKEQDAGSHETVGDEFVMSLDEPGNGEFKSIVDPWLHYITFAEIFHSDAPEPDAIHVVEVLTFTYGDEYSVEENVVSEVAAAFEERGATVREISVEEALARDQITVSEENAD